MKPRPAPRLTEAEIAANVRDITHDLEVAYFNLSLSEEEYREGLAQIEEWAASARLQAERAA